MKSKFFGHIDYFLLLCVIFLTITGILFIFSSGINSSGVNVSNEYIKQIVWASVGTVIMILVAVYDYRRTYRYARYLFVGLVVVLLVTRIFGRRVNGAKSWLGIGDLGIQPSEICKIIFILFLAWYLERSQKEEPLRRFLSASGILLVPLGLILLQPDLGTASVYIPIFLVMCFMAGIPLRYIMLVLSFGFLTILLAVLPIWQEEILRKPVPALSVLTNIKLRLILILSFLMITLIGLLGRILLKRPYFYWVTCAAGIITAALVASLLAGKVLKPYQIQRLIVFVDPSSDPRGSGWNIIQSKIAIGSGNFWGKGFINGTQSHYRFLPQQSTDFIFSIFSEEMGFVGGLVLFVIFAGILLRIIYIIRQTTNVYGTLIASGILGMFFFHFIVNVGMVMGIMPITGIPLPFLSYGGSALLTNMTAMGLLMSINNRRLDFTPYAT